MRPSVGKGAEGLAELRLSGGESLVQWVINHGEALVIENVNADPDIDPDSQDPHGSRVVVLWFACRCGRSARCWA